MKTIAETSMEVWGPGWPEYYQGESLESVWDNLGQGAGPSPQEAYDAALDSLAEQGWDVEPLEDDDFDYLGWEDDVQEVLDESGLDSSEQEQERPTYIVAIKVRGE